MATQVETAINKGKALLGSHAYDDYCQRFVRVCYEAAGISGSAGSAREACNKWKVSSSKNNIPAGAAVYFFNSADGHVGIYIGGGQMIHAWGSSGVIISDINICSNYQGWGWQGGQKPTGADSDADYSSGDGESDKSSNAPLCSTSVVSTVNVGEAVRSGPRYVNVKGLGLKYELHIINNGVDYIPIVLDTVEWTTEWCDTPGELKFTVLKDSNINITEGNVVIFKTDKYNVFYGYLFKKSKGKDGKISCTAYDQLRYFKNEDTFCYKNKTYTEVLQYIATEYNLTFSSSITDTKYKIPYAVEDNVSLFEMLKNARKETAYNTGKLYVLFDDFGSLTIRGIEELRTNYLLTEQGFEDFEYETSIDDGVYNRVQLYRDDDDTGNRAKYYYEDGTNINKWGILQQTIELGDADVPEQWGKQILALNNQKKVTLSVNGCFGNPNLRAGASLFVSLDVGDVIYDKALFFITKATHSFGKSYTCDLELAGQNDFVGEI